MKNFVQNLFLLCCCFGFSMHMTTGQQVSAEDDTGFSVPVGTSDNLFVVGNDDLDGLDMGQFNVKILTQPVDEDGDPVDGVSVSNAGFSSDIHFAVATGVAPNQLVSFQYEIMLTEFEMEYEIDLQGQGVLTGEVATVYVFITAEDSYPPIIVCPKDTVLLCEPECVCFNFNSIETVYNVASHITELNTDQGDVDVWGHNPRDPLVNHAAVISTTPAPTAGPGGTYNDLPDDDLGSPNMAFGGTGDGSGGGPGLYQNDKAIGNVLIVSNRDFEANDEAVNLGDDRIYLEFDFDAIAPVIVKSIDIFDLDGNTQAGNAGMILFDEFDMPFDTIRPPATGDNGFFTLFIEVGGVHKARYVVNGSGSVANLCFTKEDDHHSPTGVATATDPNGSGPAGPAPTIRFFDMIDTLCDDVNVITRQWRAIDCAGNITSCEQIITSINDTVAPFVVFCPGDITIEICSSDPPSVDVTGEPVFDDACPYDLIVTMEDLPMGDQCLRTIERTWTATDTCDNVATCAQTITIEDKVAPVITCPPPVLASCEFDDQDTGMASATDACNPGGEVITMMDVPGQSGDCSSSLTRYWFATDICDNTSSCEQTIEFFDNTPPDLVCPKNEDLECNASTDPMDIGGASATDNCGIPDVTFEDVNTPGVCVEYSKITRTWTATDDCDLTSVCVQIITISDNIPPTITSCPDPIVLECNPELDLNPHTNSDLGIAEGEDLCTDLVDITFSDEITDGECAQEYTIKRTWTATDCPGLTDVCVQDITIEDTTPPTLTCPTDPLTAECSDDILPAFGPVSVMDICDPNPIVDYSDVTVFHDPTCPNAYTVTRTWTAEDACGNPAIPCSQTLTVDDTQDPECKDEFIEIECDDFEMNGVPDYSKAEDNCTGIDDLVFDLLDDDVTVSDLCPQNKTIVRKWGVLDECGNQTSCRQTIEVRDTQAPDWEGLCADDITIECGTDPDPLVTGTSSATDACDDVVDVTFEDRILRGRCLPVRLIIRTWKFTDDCNNMSRCRQGIYYEDTVVPNVACPEDVTFECGDEIVLDDITFSDDCSIRRPRVRRERDRVMDCGRTYTETLTWTVYDCSGNSNSCEQTVTVEDTTNPDITCAEDRTFECEFADIIGMPYATATDACDPSVEITDVTLMVPGDCAGEFMVTWTFTATDDCMNTSTCSTTATIVDTQGPKLTCPEPAFVECTTDLSPGNMGVASATDACGTATKPTYRDFYCDLDDITVGFSGAFDHANWDTTHTGEFGDETFLAIDDFGVELFLGAEAIPEQLSEISYSIVFPFDGFIAFAYGQEGDSFVPGTAVGGYSIDGVFTMLPPTDGDIEFTGVFVEAGQTFGFTQRAYNIAPGFSISGIFDILTIEPATTLDDFDCENYILKRVWTSTDDCGNEGQCVQVILVEDTEGPDVMCPKDVTIECTVDATPANTGGMASATDACSVVNDVSFEDEEFDGDCFDVEKIRRTWFTTDACGNTGSCEQYIYIEDTEAPDITCPKDLTIECGMEVNMDGATASDLCDEEPFIGSSDSSEELCGETELVTRTWTARDCSGNESSCPQRIKYVDTTPPTFTECPSNRTISCDEYDADEFFGDATATDICDAAVDVTFESEREDGFCNYEFTITRTFTATDDCGNMETCVQLISVVDADDPECEDEFITIECDEDDDAAAHPFTSATDNCSTFDELRITLLDDDVTISDECPQNRTIVRKWEVLDACFNQTSCRQTIEVRDTQGPDLVCPDNVTIECDVTDTDPGDPGIGMATATDNCDNMPDVTFEEDTYGDPCQSTIVRYWRAKDDCGNYNREKCRQVITIKDRTNPEIECSDPITLECPADATPMEPNIPYPTVTDNCADEIMPRFRDDVTIEDCVETIKRTWTAYDNCLNSATCDQIIRIVDTTPPTITYCPEGDSFECDIAEDGIANIGMASATDACSYADVTFEDEVGPGMIPQCIDSYKITRTWTATDACGLTAQCVTEIYVSDRTDPDCEDVTIELDCEEDPSIAANPYDSATDNCDPDVRVEDEPIVDRIEEGDCDGNYTIVRKWRVFDNCGNGSSCYQFIKVSDTKGPEITFCPKDVTIECNTDFSTTTTGMATATDNCSAVIIDPSDEMDSDGCVKYIYRKFTTMDDCGNYGDYCMQTIKIEDTIDPTIYCPDNADIDCEDEPSVNSLGMASATDNCTDVDEIRIKYRDNEPTIGECSNYTIERTWTAYDLCYNTAQCVQLIRVTDTTPPDLYCPKDTEVECDDDMSPMSTGYASATDNCSAYDVTFEDEGSGDCDYTITRTWTATDACGNATDCEQIITVFDDTRPTITVCPVRVTIACDADDSPANTGGMASATDNCDVDVDVTYADVTIDDFECPIIEVIERTWTATDDCDNSSQCVQIIKKEITEGPSITCPDNIVVNAKKFYCHAEIAIDLATFEVKCDEKAVLTWERSDNQLALNDPYEVGTTTITWKVTGLCSDMSDECVQTIIVIDSQPPTIICKKIAVALNDDEGEVWVPDEFLWEAAYDNCPGDITVEVIGNTIFSCADVEDPSVSNEVEVEIQGTDLAGNVGTCFTKVKIQDNFDPVPVCQDVTIDLEVGEVSGTIDYFDVDNGSTDNTDACEMTFELDQTEWEVPGGVVTMTVTDWFGRSATCTANVTVNAPSQGGGLLATGKIWFEGSMNATRTAMIAQIGDILPLTQPYEAITGYDGTETVTSIPDGVVDWVLLQLRDQNNPSIVLAQRAAFLMENGGITDLDGVNAVNLGSINTGSYYIAVLHRNHLSVMSATPVVISVGNTGFHDFTKSGSSMGTGSQKVMSTGELAAWCGDLNADGSIDAADRSIAWNMRNQIGYLQSDATLDGQVDASERSITWNNRNKVSGLPQ